MIGRLHRKLTLLYTLTTGVILTIVVIIGLIISDQSLKAKNNEAFQNNVLNISNKLQTDSAINHSWLSQLELDNNLIIHIEENGKPLLYKGSWTPKTPREQLVKLAKAAAKEHQIDTSITPVSASFSSSPLLTIKGTDRDKYTAIVLVFPERKGYKSLVLLNDFSGFSQNLRKQRLGFILADILGIVALYLASWKFVGKSLLPIAENRKQQSDFIAAASHELRSPLAVIQTSATAILSSPGEELHFASNIKNECQRMARLINDMLLLAATDTSGWNLKLAPLDMDTLLLNIYEMYEPLCRQKHMRCILSLPDEALPTIQGDGERFMQILVILLDNAMTYSKEQGKIELHAEISKKFLLLSVIDHGTGIPEDKKPHIFDRFFRGDESRQYKEHFGLGLSIAWELVRLHKGSLTLMDTEGGGCTFEIKIQYSPTSG